MATGKAAPGQKRHIGSMTRGRLAGRAVLRSTWLLAAAAWLGGCAAPEGVSPPAGRAGPPVSAQTESAPAPGSKPTEGDRAYAPAQGPGRLSVSPGGLAGSSWYWLGTITPSGAVTPSDPGNYTLEFLEGGSVALQLDCNRGSASWQQTGARLSIGKIASTRMACPAGSEASRLTRHLQSVNTLQRTDGVLELAGPQATVILSRDPDWRLSSFECRSGQAIVVVFSQERALVRWEGSQYALTRVPGSVERYSAPGITLFRYGPEATLIVEGRQVAGPCPAKRLGL